MKSQAAGSVTSRVSPKRSPRRVSRTPITSRSGSISNVRKRNPCIDCGEIGVRAEGSRCRSCWTIERNKGKPSKEDRVRAHHLRLKYGMTLEDFEGYWFAQAGRCFICRCHMRRPEKKQGQDLDVVAVDHDHVTGKVRGLLCNKCNKGLGFFNDDPELMKKALAYLEGV